MNILYILGSLGGIIVLIEELVQFTKWIGFQRSKYRKYKSFYDKNHKYDDVKLPIGFRTKGEQEQLEARMAKKG